MSNMKIGPCAVIFQDEFLGVCDDALQFGAAVSAQPATAQQTFAQTLDRTLTALNLSVSVDVADPSRAMALLLDADGAIALSALGQRFGSRGGELKLIPLNPLDPAGYRMRRAVPDLSFKYRFKSSAPHSVAINFDILPDAEGLLMQSIEVSDADRALIPPYRATDIIALEKALTAHLAALLNLTENEEIYCAEIPEMKYGCTVSVEGQTPGKVLETNMFQGNVTFYHPDRAGVIELMNSLIEKLPFYGTSFARAVQYTGQSFPVPAERGTVSHFNGKINLIIIT